MNRREWLFRTAGVGAAAALSPRLLGALGNQELLGRGLLSQEILRRAVPSSGELLPLIGLGSSATFGQVARGGDRDALREVLRTLVEKGATVFDTAPAYGGGSSEEVAGDLAAELKLSDRIFWATKVNVAQGPMGPADPARAREQIQASFTRLRKRPIDLIQVHNMSDVPTHLGILKEMKAAKQIRYIGVTSTMPQQFEQLEQVMRSEPLDFIGVDYAIDSRLVEQRILPLAKDRGIGTLIYMPFGRYRLWNRVKGQEVPAWASEFDAYTWGQFFLKFVAADPRVTVITPATSRAANMEDNLGAAMGRLPDAAMRQRMIRWVEDG